MRTLLRFVLFLSLFLILAAVGGYVYIQKSKTETVEVFNFTSCSERYPVMESYPRRCITPEGAEFVENVPAPVRETYTSKFGDFSFDYPASTDEGGGYVVVESDAGSTTDGALLSMTLYSASDYEAFLQGGEGREAPPGISITLYSDTGEPLAGWVEPILRESGAPTSTPELTTLSGARAVRVSGSGLYLFDALVAMRKGRVYVVRGEYLEPESQERSDFIELLGSWRFLEETAIEEPSVEATSTIEASPLSTPSME